MEIVWLASENEIKIRALKDFLKLSNFSVEFCDAHLIGNPEQPINSGELCASRRIEYLERIVVLQNFAVSIENELVVKDGKVFDVAVVCVRNDKDDYFFGTSSNYKAEIPFEIYEKIRSCAKVSKEGMSLTLGKEYFEKELGLPHNNWHYKYAGFSRKTQITDALIEAFSKCVKEKVLYIDNFPKQGVKFQYQGKIWSDPVYHSMLNLITVAKIKHFELNPTKIAGIDSRGYISGSTLAHMLGIGFICITKAGKTPGVTKNLKGSTEYSQIELEVNPNLISTNDSVLIIDDLVATGGSFLAASSLIKECGAKVCACVSILKVGPLFEEAVSKLGIKPLCILE